MEPHNHAGGGGEEGEAQKEKSENANLQQPIPNKTRKYLWWLRMAIYSFFVLTGQSAATLLGRLYYDRGGNSKWMATLVQPAGFPILLPFLFLSSLKHEPRDNDNDDNVNPRIQKPKISTLVMLYVFLGIFIAADCMLYSIGLLYLPVSTYSLLCASQLAFNALFSYFLNSQKFTPFIVNSLVLLTISSTLLVFQEDDPSGPAKVSRGKYAIGFVCTIAASAGYALLISVTQFAFKRIIRSQNFRAVMDMIVYPSIAATLVVLVGFFASGEWDGIKAEIGRFELGKVSYVMTLVWTAVSWQVFNIGAVGLIFEVSSLFSNVISILGLPIVPVMAVFTFHDSMNGVKVVSMVLAVWGFISYIYQHYVDDKKLKVGNAESVNGHSEVSLIERA